LLPILLGGVVLGGPPCVDVFEDVAFFHGMVGLWMQLARSLQRLVVVFLVVPPPVGALDCIHFVVVVAGALSSEIVAIVAPPVPTFPMIAVVGAAVVSVVEATATIISPRRLVGTSRIVPDEFFCVVGVGVIFSRGEELGHRCWPFAQQLVPQCFMEAQPLDESRYGLVVGNFWDLKAHIRESSDVVAQRLVFPIPYPLEVVLVPGLLIGSDEVVDERLAEFFPRVERVLGQAQEP
jgi:hypothetical protein